MIFSPATWPASRMGKRTVVSGGTVIGHYKSPAGEVTGVFDLSGEGEATVVERADGVYKNQLGGDLTVTDGQVDISGEPLVI